MLGKKRVNKYLDCVLILKLIRSGGFYKQFLCSGLRRMQLWTHAVLVLPSNQIYLVPIACNSSAVLGVSNPSVEEIT